MKKCILLLFVSLFQYSVAQKNTIIIIADDLSTDYLGYYPNVGDTVATPNIRSLLAQGVQFNNAWANPICSPTRSALFTGRYAFRTGVGDVISTQTSAQLDTSERSVAKLLHDFAPFNYVTANVGKWHLHTPNPIPQRNFPEYMGYDLYAGNFNGAITDYFDWQRIKNGVLDTVTTYATTQTVNDAIDWLDTLSTTKPFFLWVAFNAPHSPFHLPPLNLHTYINLPGTTAHINSNPTLYFKAMVQAMDTEIGRLFQYLDANNLRDSTNIIFIGDNGEDRSISQALDTSHTKGTLYEQGVSVPMIISGSSILNPGRQSDALVSTPDLFATILELSGFSNWINFIPAAKLPVDSKSLMPILISDATEVREWIFTEQFKVTSSPSAGKAIKTKTHKLIKFDTGNSEFYDLTLDPNEQNDLVGQTLTTIQTQQFNFLCNELNALLNQSTCNVLQSLNAISSEKNLPKLFPNPCIDKINVQWKNHENEFLELHDVLGKSMMVAKPGIWNLSTLNPGLYFLISSKHPSTGVVKLLKVD